MKIERGTHKAYFQKQVPLGTLPLSFISNDEKDKIINIKIREDFSKPYVETPVYPHKTYSTTDVLFFTKQKKPITNVSPLFQQMDDGNYEVLSQNIKEFYPKEFTYSVLLQRTDTYKRSIDYNIELDFTRVTDARIRQSLLAVIQNKETMQRYPSNIVCNGGEVQTSVLLPKKADFIFSSYDDINDADINEALAAHKNVWLYDESFNGNIINNATKDEASFTVANSYIFSSVSGILDPITKNGTKYAITAPDADWSMFTESEDTTVVSGFFTSAGPLAIIHKKNYGYLIVSHPSFLQNLNTGFDHNLALRLFMETILYTYLNGYYQTQTKTSFITDEPIDYYIHSARRYYLTHPKISLTRILQSESFNTEIQYNVVRVDTAPRNLQDTEIFAVSYIGLSRFNDLLFKKKELTAMKDPSKGNNMLIYTANKILAIYRPDQIDIWEIESGVSIRQIDTYQLGISEIKSSKHKINLTQETIVELPAVGNWVIYYDPDLATIKIASAGINLPNHGIPIADLTVSINEEIDYKDIRIPGGGEASATPNYEMIDTGNLYGRPYRYGCPMIIRIPSRYKPMQEEIRNEVEKHIASGDYPIILYKD